MATLESSILDATPPAARPPPGCVAEPSTVRPTGRLSQGRPSVEPTRACRCALEDELTAVARLRGVTLASHSWSHRNLALLSASELRDELERPLGGLRGRFEGVIPWLAYPYGLMSAEAAHIAAEVGYVAACRGAGGWSPVPVRDQFGISRLNVPAEVSLEGFGLRTAGPFAA